MAYKQDGFLTGLLANFGKRKEIKRDVKETTGAWNRDSNTVNVKEGDNVIEMPMRKYTKKALDTTPKAVVSRRSSEAYSHGDKLVEGYDGKGVGFNMEFNEESTSSEPKKRKSRVKARDAKYGISKGKKGYQKIRKK